MKDKRFELIYREDAKGSFYAARCMPLGLTAYGDTPEEAKTRLKEMFCLLVNAWV